MNRLVLLRHGKSDWPPGVPDHERPLAPRGRRQAAEAGQWLRANLAVDVAVVSTAVRARSTWDLAALTVPEVRFDDRVYAATASTLLAVAEEASAAPTVLLVGHDPGLEDLVEQLTGIHAAMPTSAIAVIDVGPGALVHHGRPPGAARAG